MKMTGTAISIVRPVWGTLCPALDNSFGDREFGTVQNRGRLLLDYSYRACSLYDIITSRCQLWEVEKSCYFILYSLFTPSLGIAATKTASFKSRCPSFHSESEEGRRAVQQALWLSEREDWKPKAYPGTEQKVSRHTILPTKMRECSDSDLP